MQLPTRGVFINSAQKECSGCILKYQVSIRERVVNFIEKVFAPRKNSAWFQRQEFGTVPTPETHGRGLALRKLRGFPQMPSINSNQACHIRWMIRRDLPFVLNIENASFEFPWTEDEFIRCLRQRDCIGMVAERNEEVAGFMIYELHKNRIHILSFAVHPDYRRQGIGRSMIDKLASKLAYQRRNRIVLEVRETNLDAQLFFRQLGFRATSVLRSFYEDTPEDAFLMQYRVALETAANDEGRAAA
jgi:ribosomal-protein-alanine N-acetyltransferase